MSAVAILTCNLSVAGTVYASTSGSWMQLLQQQSNSPLKIQVSLDVKNLTLTQFIKELQKKVGTNAYFNMPIDGLTNNNADITIKETASLEKILNDVLTKRKLTYAIDGKVFMITKVDAKVFPQVTFNVIDAGTNEPVIGATVIVNNTSIGAICDDKGRAILRNIKEGAEIEISMVGYKSTKVNVKTNNIITIKLVQETLQVADVVVTGYQVMDKRMSTSSIVSLKGEDVIESVGMSIDQMLQGKVAGMSVMSQSSTVGAAPKIRIRGSSSIVGSREPVWVVDGIVLEDPVKLDPTLLNSPDYVNLVGNAISSLNPEDIDRIDVLKDASATAIYGVKAANGVIVITTKRGKQGPPSVRYSLAMNVIERPRASQMFMMNSADRIDVSQELHERGLEYQGFTPRSVGYEGALQDLWDGKINDSQFNLRVKSLKESNNDWYKELFRNSFSHSHSLSVSGANEKVNYYISVGYSDQMGSPKTEKGDRLNFMSNVDIKFSERLTARLGLSASSSSDERPHSAISLNKYAYYTSPTIPARNADGSLFFYDAKDAYPKTPNLPYNILNELDESSNTTKQLGYNANLNLSYKITSWLNLNAIVAYGGTTSKSEEYFTEKTFQASEIRKTAYGFKFANTSKDNPDYVNYVDNINSLPFGGVLNADDYINNMYNGRASLSFNKIFASKHSVSADVGGEIRSTNYSGVTSETYGYMPDRGKSTVTVDHTLYKQYTKDEMGRHPKYTDTRDNTMSYYATASYGYDMKYILSVNVRGDASNKLGMDKTARFLPIWSIAGRWNIEQESFMKSAEWVNGLAIRSSYGLQGNVTDAHNPNMLIKFGTLDSKSEEYETVLSSLPNRGLLWEKTESFNLGLDFSLLNSRIRGTFEYYSKLGKNQLISALVAPSNGGSIVTVNAGDISNKGWEFTLATTLVKTRDFGWDLSFNTSKNRNRITGANEIPYSYMDYTSGTIIRNGSAVNSFYNYMFSGLDNTGWPTFKGTEERDENGNVWGSKEIAFARVFAYGGKREADLTGGINTSLSYKWISLSAQFSLSLGAKTRLNNLFDKGNFKLPYPHENMQSEFVNRWRKPGDEAYTNIPALTDRVGSLVPDGPMKEAYKSVWQMYDNSDLRTVSANFLRCRSLSVLISIPSSWTNKFYCKAASFSLGVNNPFVIKSKSLNGRDPEQIDLANGVLPPLRTYSMSLSLSF